jgi:serine/threonine protein phosphatase PrpC
MQVGTMLKAAGDSHPGLQRAVNEDRFHFDPIRGLFVVVDGVGGQAAGEKAAETALAMVRTRLERETGAVEDRVRDAITLANNEIHRLASLRVEWQGMACVLTIAVVTNGEVVIGHVGDTRLYKLRAGRIEKLTRDHSPVGEREDAGELTERDAMQHPRRNEVYRDVGSERHEPDDPHFIDVFRQPLEPDAALLLCSDGLTDAITAAAITEVVGAFAGHPFEIVRGLISAANAAGGKDNVTVVYAEGPRFATGEDTRDLRAHRTRPIVSTPVASTPVPSAGVGMPGSTRIPAASVSGTQPSRWRLVALVVLILVVAGLAAYWQRERLPWLDFSRLTTLRNAMSGGSAGPSVIRVTSGQSIAAAIERAAAGAEVVVEPGEYREQVRLKTGVRVVSLVPRSASLRLPGGASETDAAVVAFEVSGAVFSGFRIVGDAATPLGAGVVVRNSNIVLNDIEITGAHNAAIEYVGADGGSLVAAYLHDNPGVAIVVRAGSSPRIAHSAFVRNAASERAAALLLIEAGARPVLTANTFYGVRPESVIVPAALGRAALERDNWFINVAERPAPPARGGRGRR